MRPLIAVPIGDPAGIGPEIVIRALADRNTTESARCVIVGSRKVMEKALTYPGMPQLVIHTLKDPREGDYAPGTIEIVDIDNMDMDAFVPGQVSGMCGRAAYEYIAEAIALANEGIVQAVATTPINKESLKAGNVNFIGHTEIFSALTGTHDPLTLFEVRNLRVFFLTRHVSLRKACDMVTKDRIVDYVIRCTEALRKLGITEGTMAIAGLNPHSGEHGLFGDEEVKEVFPAVAELQERGYKVAGPIGADSVFAQALNGKYNSVLSLYHDQGHIATKTLDFERTISITAGMPILRTSVDHGTAFDIAGQGIASPVSMTEAIRLAVKYAPAFSSEKTKGCSCTAEEAAEKADA
ncbi:MAG: 4-hydroxythreonine-4-phosphate dehydrogenase PdxA [Eubacterium sp.]|nr:4-hydroxythreonine-4-phosphate dehydrogenase PdxA [Eubacterium sp.]